MVPTLAAQLSGLDPEQMTALLEALGPETRRLIVRRIRVIENVERCGRNEPVVRVGGAKERIAGDDHHHDDAHAV